MNNKKMPNVGQVDKAKDFKKTLKKLIHYLNEHHLILIIIFIFAIGSTIFSIVGPKILGNATTELFNGVIAKLTNNGSINFNKIYHILLILLALYLVSALFSYIQGYLMSGVTQKTTYRMRKEISEKINRLPLSYFDKKTHGEVLSTIINDVDTLQQGLNQSATQLITSITTIIGILVMMLSINVTITLLTLLILPISTFMMLIVVKYSQKYFADQQRYLANINGQIEEMYSNHIVVKAFNAENKVLKKFNKDNDELYKCGWKSQFISGIMHPIMNFLGNLSYVIVAIVGSIYASKGIITVGNIQSFIQYSKQFTNPIGQLAQISNMIQSMIAASERIFEFLETPEESKDTTHPIDTTNIVGEVTFEHVSFGYEPNQVIIKDFNTKARAGSKIAIVGPTGAGKTTLVKLLMRYYDLNSGSIKIDGHDIRDFRRSDLRKLFGMVLQDTWLFNGTIMENLRYGKLDATDDEVIAAAKTAHVHHFIQTLPESYHMVLNEETNNVSSGQKQLLTIARAVLANPKILILDEATSNVDTRTEILIQKAMDELMKGRTTFIIAHRLSTIKNADLILVLNNGDIVEQGNHQELLSKNGFYAKLYQSQFDRTK